ncbi:unnamed protein product, partial [Meganyctiphanes norvegica]
YNQCDKVFSIETALIKHQVVHTREKPYQCSQCFKAFTQKNNLTYHMRRTHAGEKPYQCSKCDKAFTQNNTLICHMRNHTGERPYKCSQCDKTFPMNSYL